MSNQQTQLQILLEKPEWTTEEKQWLLSYLENSDGVELKERMQRLFESDIENAKRIDLVLSEKLLSNIHQKTGIQDKPAKAKHVRLWAQRMAAACVIGLVALSTFLWIKNNPKQPVAETKTNSNIQKNDVAPGGDKAVLTLADGSTIVLDSAQNGALAQQGNTRVIKINGKLNYNASGKGTDEILYNTIATPRGGQYQVELSDGTKVWLNAASSIRFPAVFAANERIVEVSGEVYFEVAHLDLSINNMDAKKATTKVPFIVKIKAPSGNVGQVEVLGTHFNINAYDDESIVKTTLLEGSVKFIKDGANTMLKPGQQSQLLKNGQLNVADGVDVDKVVAWKNGFFDFDGSDFETIARQLARWYDVEVVYNRKIDDLFHAEIPRDTKLSDVIKALELTGKVRFEINGKKIIVMP